MELFDEKKRKFYEHNTLAKILRMDFNIINDHGIENSVDSLNTANAVSYIFSLTGIPSIEVEGDYIVGDNVKFNVDDTYPKVDYVDNLSDRDENTDVGMMPPSISIL